MKKKTAKTKAQGAKPEAKTNGRPPMPFNQAACDEICERLARGQPLSRIVADPHIPSLPTIYKWLREHEAFAADYARARDDQADTHADEITAIADENPQTVPVYDRDGQLIEIKIDTAFEAWRKTRIDARKWLASKIKPKRYGDKLQAEHSGPDGGPIQAQVVQIVVTGVEPKAQEDGG